MDKPDIIDDFLESEINTLELYNAIVEFINSYEIRSGEFEANEYIILKLNRDNFILYPELVYKDGSVSVPYSMSIYKHKLLEVINDYAMRIGILK